MDWNMLSSVIVPLKFEISLFLIEESGLKLWKDWAKFNAKIYISLLNWREWIETSCHKEVFLTEPDISLLNWREWIETLYIFLTCSPVGDISLLNWREWIETLLPYTCYPHNLISLFLIEESGLKLEVALLEIGFSKYLSS